MKKLYFTFILYFLLSVFLFANFAGADIVPKGLVAYWSFDTATFKGNTVKDLIGGNDGELDGKPKEVAGKIGQALQFDGSNGIKVAGTDSLNFNGAEEFSAAAWFKPEKDDPVGNQAAAGCCGSIIAQRNANGWAIRYDGRNPGQEIEFIVCPGWQGDGGFGAPKVKTNEWHYITGVVSKKNMSLYLDGELVVEAPFNGPVTSTGPETNIAKASDGSFIGLIDEVIIYNRALTAGEVFQNFKSTRFFAVDTVGKLATCWGDIKK